MDKPKPTNTNNDIGSFAYVRSFVIENYKLVTALVGVGAGLLWLDHTLATQDHLKTAKAELQEQITNAETAIEQNLDNSACEIKEKLERLEAHMEFYKRQDQETSNKARIDYLQSQSKLSTKESTELQMRMNTDPTLVAQRDDAAKTESEHLQRAIECYHRHSNPGTPK